MKQFIIALTTKDYGKGFPGVVFLDYIFIDAVVTQGEQVTRSATTRAMQSDQVKKAQKSFSAQWLLPKKIGTGDWKRNEDLQRTAPESTHKSLSRHRRKYSCTMT